MALLYNYKISICGIKMNKICLKFSIIMIILIIFFQFEQEICYFTEICQNSKFIY